MGELRSQDKRDKLRLLYAQTPSGGNAEGKRLQPLLMDALTACDAAINGVVPGTFLSSTSEAGGTASFTMIGGDFSPVVAKRLIGELLDLYDKVIEDGADPDQDGAIFAAMMAGLKPIRSYRSDFTGLRYGIGFCGN